MLAVARRANVALPERRLPRPTVLSPPVQSPNLSVAGEGRPVSDLDDVTSAALHTLSSRTPQEDSLLGITAAMSAESNLEALLDRIL